MIKDVTASFNTLRTRLLGLNAKVRPECVGVVCVCALCVCGVCVCVCVCVCVSLCVCVYVVSPHLYIALDKSIC